MIPPTLHFGIPVLREAAALALLDVPRNQEMTRNPETMHVPLRKILTALHQSHDIHDVIVLLRAGYRCSNFTYNALSRYTSIVSQDTKATCTDVVSSISQKVLRQLMILRKLTGSHKFEAISTCWLRSAKLTKLLTVS